MCGITRGTTPLLIFRLPIDTSELEAVWITLSQNDTVVVNKTLDQCECSDKTIAVHLTQNDTLLLEGAKNTEIQIRARTHEDEALASKVIKVKTNSILKDGVI